jgi:hypothetical protein
LARSRWGFLLRRPATATDGVDGQRPELVEREAPVQVVLQHVLDAVQLGVPFGVVGLFPRLGALEGDLVLREELSEPFPADLHDPSRVVPQILGQLADAPPGEGSPQLLGTGLGRLDDERLVLSRDPAGTATRPLGVQACHPQPVEVVDHLPDTILRGLHQPSDHGHRVAARRCQHHHRPAIAHYARLPLALTTTHQPLKPAALLVAQAPYSHRFSHTDSFAINDRPMVDYPGVPDRSGH